MSAPIKTRLKSSVEIKEISNQLFNIIRDKFINGKRTNEFYVEVNIDFLQVGHGFRPFGKNGPNDFIDFTLSVCGTKVSGLGKYDASDILNNLKKSLVDNNHQDVIECEDKDIFLTYGNFIPDMVLPLKYRYYSKPCKEFDELNKLLKKRCGKELGYKDLYRVDLFGKRGSYSESGSQYLFCYDAKYCTKAIKWVKDNYKDKQKLTFEVTTIDDIDTDYSVRYETECYGSRLVTLHFNLKTEGGKERGNYTIY